MTDQRRPSRGDVARLLIGVDGPEGRTPAAVAYLVAPMARTWLDVARTRNGKAATAELAAWVASLEVLAADYRRSLSADGRVDGRLEPLKVDRPDADLVIGLPTEEAARRLDLTVRSVVRLLEQNTLDGVKVGRTWLVDPASIERLRHLRKAS